MSGLAAAAGPMSTGDAYGFPPARPLCTAMMPTPVSRTAWMNGAPTWGRAGIVVVEEPAVRRVRVHLPGAQLVSRGDVGHRRHGGVDRADVGNGVALDQHPAVAAQAGRQLAAALHRRDRQRVGLADDRDRRDHGHRRVAAAEDEVVPVLDGEAVGPVRLAARRLRKSVAPRAELEEVGLHVDDARRRRAAPWTSSLASATSRGRRLADPEHPAALEARAHANDLPSPSRAPAARRPCRPPTTGTAVATSRAGGRGRRR